METKGETFMDGAKILDIEDQGRDVLRGMITNLVSSVKEKLEEGNKPHVAVLLEENEVRSEVQTYDELSEYVSGVISQSYIFKDGAVIPDLDASGRSIIGLMAENMVDSVAQKLDEQGLDDEIRTTGSDTVQEQIKDDNPLVSLTNQYLSPRQNGELKDGTVIADIDFSGRAAIRVMIENMIQCVAKDLERARQREQDDGKGLPVDEESQDNESIELTDVNTRNLLTENSHPDGNDKSSDATTMFKGNDEAKVNVKDAKKKKKGFKAGKWFSGLFRCCFGKQKTIK